MREKEHRRAKYTGDKSTTVRLEFYKILKVEGPNMPTGLRLV